MTRAEAIEVLNEMYSDWRTDKERDALEYAIIILENSDCHVLVQDMRKESE